MSKTWIGAKRIATRDSFEVVYHDLETDEYGACPRGQPQGHFDEYQRFHEHRCIYFPARMTVREIEAEEGKQEWGLGY